MRCGIDTSGVARNDRVTKSCQEGTGRMSGTQALIVGSPRATYANTRQIQELGRAEEKEYRRSETGAGKPSRVVRVTQSDGMNIAFSQFVHSLVNCPCFRRCQCRIRVIKECGTSSTQPMSYSASPHTWKRGHCRRSKSLQFCVVQEALPPTCRFASSAGFWGMDDRLIEHTFVS